MADQKIISAARQHGWNSYQVAKAIHEELRRRQPVIHVRTWK